MMFRFLKKWLPQKSHEKPLQAQNRIIAPLEWPSRFLGNLLILALIAATSMIIITIRDNLIDKKIDSFLGQFYNYSVQYGWAIDDIIVEGRYKTETEDLLKQINLSRKNNILEVDLKALKEKIEQLPWIEKAEIKRTYSPNVLQIRLHEKQVLALWQSGDKFYPVDHKGKIIEAEYTPHKPILVIVGRKAPEKITELLQVTSTAPSLHKRIKAAVLYSGRRWDIVFDDLENGVTVKMPEKDMEKAWKKFIKINKLHGLLKRKLTFIDLRYKNKLIVTVGDSDKTETQTKNRQ